MRIFLGIKLPDKTAKLIQKTIVPLQQKYYTATWVQPKNFHVTVTFLGEVDDYKRYIPRIEEVLYDVKPFPLDLFQGGIFQRDTLTLFIECYRQKVLENIALEMNEKLLHRTLEHRYIPHITIGRTRNPSKQQYLHMKRQLQALSFEESFVVDSIILYRSELIRGSGPEYEVLETFTLAE